MKERDRLREATVRCLEALWSEGPRGVVRELQQRPGDSQVLARRLELLYRSGLLPEADASGSMEAPREEP